ncbi:YdcH family protein [Roseobacter sp. YSTF-M11]|uniref:YdcH family protein n=1 Tax=Roseobacter insulae TaxID=2859783 RepID=A0A9X1JY06_9RHOB|nr:YdcH family protein [Roseobacter insulae]MBW4707716.1 YdcH family protein [Roseobacter insulae]
MTHTPHELAEDFPDAADQIAALRQNDAHFARLADAYHAINRDVHRAETNVEPTADDHLTDMRKQRMRLKDEIRAYLARSDA